MNKKIIIMIAVAALIFAASVIGTIYVYRPSESRIAVVLQDGNPIYKFDLDTAENQTIVVESPDGTSSNTIKIENGEISVSEADCPDGTCVKTGILRSEDIPIVCLPNKLVIRFSEDGE
jgi:hypothetical protein